MPLFSADFPTLLEGSAVGMIGPNRISCRFTVNNSYTPQDKSAANIRHKMQALGESIATDKSRSELSRLINGSSLARTVNQNYVASVRKLKELLDAKGGDHLSAEVFQSAMRGVVSNAIWDRVEEFVSLLGDCESPAEELFFIALDTVLNTRPVSVHYKTTSMPDDDLFDDLYDYSNEGDDAIVVIELQGTVMPQERMTSWNVRPYRADFLITCVRKSGDQRSPVIRTMTAIEIDGRAHATDESRSRDNERDRVFRELNIATDRYTGVDILSDPFACAKRAVDHFLAL